MLYESNSIDCCLWKGMQRHQHSPSLSTSFSTQRSARRSTSKKHIIHSWPHNLEQWEERYLKESLAWELLQVEEYNEHWVPFYLLCTPCHLNYTVVAKTETIEEDSRWTEFRGIREGCKKSKWKFKMAFAMKGGGLEGVSFAIKLFWKMIFLKTI